MTEPLNWTSQHRNIFLQFSSWYRGLGKRTYMRVHAHKHAHKHTAQIRLQQYPDC